MFTSTHRMLLTA